MNQHHRIVRPDPLAADASQLPWTRQWRIGLAAGVALAVAAGGLAGAGAIPAGFEPQLVLLIRFMALVKLAAAIGAALLIGWRLGQPPRPRFAFGYAVGAMLMAFGPALMWRMHGIIPGSTLFYVGLIVLVICARAEGKANLAPRLRALFARRPPTAGMGQPFSGAGWPPSK